jgi:hypothetical protein
MGYDDALEVEEFVVVGDSIDDEDQERPSGRWMTAPQ